MKTLTSSLLNSIAAAVCIGAALHSSHAAIIAYDGFSSSDYTAGQLLGQNPTIAGFTGAWAGGSNIYEGGAGSALTYAGVASDNTGGAFSNVAGNRAGRDFNPTLTGSNVFYLSLMMKNTAVNATDYRAFELYNFGNRLLQVGANGDNGDSGANWGMRAIDNNSYRVTTSVAAVANATVFAVIKITLSTTAGADSVQLWINPTDLSSETLSTNSVALSGFDVTNNSITNFRLASFNGTAVSYWDEIRVGTSWNDVTPIPEPATWALLAAGLTAFVVFRRRRLG